MLRSDLLQELDQILQPWNFKDYGPNGLQVEGRAEIRRLVTGVTASRALIEAAIEAQADAILVHHGLFWRGQTGVVTGWMRRRLGLLLGHDINLLAYHLPLDAHPELGNNAQLARQLGLVTQRQFGEQNLISIGQPEQGEFASAQALADHVSARLGRSVQLADGLPAGRPVRTIAWCTGGAQGQFEAALEAGADAYLTGEMSEPQPHYARECEAAFLACGHHATERYGVQALGAEIARRCQLEHIHIDIDNPA